MKKLFLIAIAIFSCSCIYANEPEKIELLSAKVILKNSDGYFVLSDGSTWKAIGFSVRWKTLSEWWNNVQLVPANYECIPNDWFLGTQIEVYSKYRNLNVNEADASNQDSLKQCTHLLVNTRTGQVLFAIALHPADCIVQLFKEAHQEGYNTGYSDGRYKSNQNTTEIYNNGHSDGYKAGYLDGLQAAVKEEQRRN